MTGRNSSSIALCGIPLSLLSQAPTVSTASVTPCTSFATMFRMRINQHLAFLLHRNDSITTPSFPIATSTIFHAFHTNLLQTLLPQQSIPVLIPTWHPRPSTISPVYHLQQTLCIGQRLTFLPHVDLSTFYHHRLHPSSGSARGAFHCQPVSMPSFSFPDYPLTHHF